MQVQSATQSTVRSAVAMEGCPHGLSAGSCPACSGGGGGGGGGAVKKNTAGLMNWNQAWAAWNALQTQNTRQADYLKSLTANQFQQQNQMLANGQRVAIASALARMIQGAMPLIQAFSQVMSAPARAFGQLTQTVQGVLRQVSQFLLSPGDNFPLTQRIVSLLGDGKKLLEDILHHNLENLKSLLSKLQFVERMAQIEQMMGKALQTMASQSVQLLQFAKEGVQAVFEKFKRWLKEEKGDEKPPSKRQNKGKR